MKTTHTPSHQHGFFDLGFSVALLAIFGVATTAIVANEASQSPQQLATSTVASIGDEQPEPDC
jgi:hypothetical protein